MGAAAAQQPGQCRVLASATEKGTGAGTGSDSLVDPVSEVIIAGQPRVVLCAHPGSAVQGTEFIESYSDVLKSESCAKLLKLSDTS